MKVRGLIENLYKSEKIEKTIYAIGEVHPEVAFNHYKHYLENYFRIVKDAPEKNFLNDFDFIFSQSLSYLAREVKYGVDPNETLNSINSFVKNIQKKCESNFIRFLLDKVLNDYNNVLKKELDTIINLGPRLLFLEGRENILSNMIKAETAKKSGTERIVYLDEGLERKISDFIGFQKNRENFWAYKISENFLDENDIGLIIVGMGHLDPNLASKFNIKWNMNFLDALCEDLVTRKIESKFLEHINSVRFSLANSYGKVSTEKRIGKLKDLLRKRGIEVEVLGMFY